MGDPIHYLMSRSHFILHLFLCLQVVSLAVNAQSRGIKGGLTLSSLSTGDSTYDHLKPSGHVGVYSSSSLNDWLGLQAELLYIQKGARESYSIIGGYGVSKIKLNYLELPVLAYAQWESLRFYAGVYLSSLLWAKVTNEGSDGTVYLKGVEDRSEYNTFDFGIIGGLGVQLAFLELGARYEYGLRSLGEGNLFIGTLPTAKNITLQAYVGFGF